jgi:hypothetical protein
MAGAAAAAMDLGEDHETSAAPHALVPRPEYQTLANFVVEKKIGQGQFSTVYRARCTFDDAVVALKKVDVRCVMTGRVSVLISRAQIFGMTDAKSRADCLKEIDLLKVGCEWGCARTVLTLLTHSLSTTRT